MNRQPFEKPPQWWSPGLNRRWIRVWRPLRRREQLKRQRLLHVEVNGTERIREVLRTDAGVLITPNHSSHADPLALYAAADQLDSAFYIMVAWQVFHRSGRIRRAVLRQHGCFSVDREGTDLKALRQACEVLQSAPHPLVIFPEGEVYHLNGRTTPFREGAAAIALMAAKKAKRPVVCVPCAMRYEYVEDPLPQLLELMDRLERAVLWRPRPGLPLQQRIYHLAEALLSLKEVEFFGWACSGPLPQRIAGLIDFILDRIESRLSHSPAATTVPERIKAARQQVIKRLEDLPADHAERQSLFDDLDDLFLAVQVFSYPGDYVSESPSIERMAETLDKFEEDVLGVKTATIRGARKATVTFGAPVPVDDEKRQAGAANLTRLLEEDVRRLLQVGPADDDDLAARSPQPVPQVIV